MNHRATGFGFCALAVILFISRYLVVAIYLQGTSMWIGAAMQEVHQRGILPQLHAAAGMCLIVGIVYLAVAEIIYRCGILRKSTGCENTIA